MSLFKIVGNGKAATYGILLFIVILIVLCARCSHAKAAEIDLNTGASFGNVGVGPVLGLDVRFPQSDSVDLFGGTTLWGETPKVTTNWDWHAGVRSCRWSVCASIGATYLQKEDRIDGTHTNFYLALSYVFGGRLASVGVFHVSNAGTSDVNIGRQAAFASWRLQ